MNGKVCLRSESLSIAMISVHSSPMGRLGTQDTGGMSVYIRELSRQLALGGNRVDIFTRPGDGLAPGEALRLSANVRLIAIRIGPDPAAPKTALYPHLTGFFRGMDRFRRTQGVGYDLIHSHYWLSGRVGQQASGEWGVPHVVTFHTLGAAKNLACGAASEPEVRLSAERGLVNACDRVLATCGREKEALLSLCGAHPARVEVAPCGVDMDLFRPLDRALVRERVGIGRDEQVILYVGRFAPEKGLDRLLAAAARLQHLPRLRLIVIGGDGEQDAACRRMQDLSRRLGIAGRVAFRGRLEQSELPRYYSAADLLALPSSYESFGMAALEALACGTPVAATRVGAMEDLLREHSNGRLAPDFHPASLADVLERLLRDLSAGPPKTEAVRSSVRSFGWPRVAADVQAIYRELAAGRAAGVPAAAGGTGRPCPGFFSPAPLEAR